MSAASRGPSSSLKSSFLTLLGICSVACGSPHKREGVFDSILVLEDRCVGVVIDDSKTLITPSHCGSDMRSAHDLFGITRTIEKCDSHPDALFGNGTDFQFCRLRDGHMSVAARVWEGATVPRSRLYLIQVDESSLELIDVQYISEGRGEMVLQAPAHSVCRGSSGSPIFSTEAGAPKLVAFVSTRKQTQNCANPGEFHAVLVAPALEWKERAY